MAMACFSTSFGVLKGFMHPCHSHKKGRLGLGLGMGVTDVTVRLEVVAEAAAAVADAAVVGLVEAADVVEVVDDAEGDVGLAIPFPFPLPLT